jgi:hypothetical protein
MRMSGGCLCGKVKYTAEGDPVFTAVSRNKLAPFLRSLLRSQPQLSP